jgi:hypothetical protein
VAGVDRVKGAKVESDLHFNELKFNLLLFNNDLVGFIDAQTQGIACYSY